MTTVRTPLEQKADAAGWSIVEWQYVARLVVEAKMTRDDAIRLMLGETSTKGEV